MAAIELEWPDLADAETVGWLTLSTLFPTSDIPSTVFLSVVKQTPKIGAPSWTCFSHAPPLITAASSKPVDRALVHLITGLAAAPVACALVSLGGTPISGSIKDDGSALKSAPYERSSGDYRCNKSDATTECDMRKTIHLDLTGGKHTLLPSNSNGPLFPSPIFAPRRKNKGQVPHRMYA